MDLVYRKFKRRRAGPCNICGEVGSLTWDHVPPKGGIELEPVEIDRAAAAYVSSLASEKPEVSHDGLRFRTICAKCNSLLGATYDPALNELARTVGRFLRTPLTLPAVAQVETRPTAVVRAVLGHLLAARLSSEDGFFDPDIRGLVLDPARAIPDQIHIHYWLYPYGQQIVVRDALMPAVRGRYSDFQRFGVLKYFPIAYLATTAPVYEGLDSLTSWRNEPASFSVQIPINLRSARDPYWPEAPAPDNWLFGGHDLMESIRAHPRPGLFKQKISPGG